MSVAGFIVAYLARWLPHPVETGLKKIGNPNESSPVLVTANFSLTVKRVTAALKGQNLWLLVANSDGINVWCAAAGGIFTENRIIDAVKVSGLADKVKHHELILPPLAAPGVNREAIKKETGFHARFGPVQAADVPAYLAAGKKKIEQMRRFNFDLNHRLDMILPMNFPVWAIVAAIMAIFFRPILPGFTILFWAVVVFMYLMIDYIPGKTGWAQAAISATGAIAVCAALDYFRSGDPLANWGWLIGIFVVFMAVGFDLAGIATGRKSDPEQLLIKLGIKSLGPLFSLKDAGDIHLDRHKCTGCSTCQEVCPTGVYGGLDKDKKTTIARPDSCFSCGACVKQCPANALSLESPVA